MRGAIICPLFLHFFLSNLNRPRLQRICGNSDPFFLFVVEFADSAEEILKKVRLKAPFGLFFIFRSTCHINRIGPTKLNTWGIIIEKNNFYTMRKIKFIIFFFITSFLFQTKCQCQSELYKIYALPPDQKMKVETCHWFVLIFDWKKGWVQRLQFFACPILFTVCMTRWIVDCNWICTHDLSLPTYDCGKAPLPIIFCFLLPKQIRN